MQREQVPVVGSDATEAAAVAPAGAQPVALGRAERYRELIATKVSASWREIPHFAVTREVGAEAMLSVLERLRSSGFSPSSTFTDLLLRVLGLALRSTGNGGPVDLGLAVATDAGVVIPVVTDVLSFDPEALAGARAAAVERAKAGQLSRADLEAHPLSTLSNLGAYGVDSFTGIIASGQTSLLTTGRARPRLVPSPGGAPTTSTTFVATLNVDHRHIDGVGAAQVLAAFAAAAEAMDLPF